MKIGVLGGMFDPPHIGHLRMGLEARELLGLDELRLLPAGEPVHRGPTQASGAQRIAMAERAAASLEGFRVDARECERGGPSYMVDTLASLRAERPGDSLYLLLGTDAFHGLPTWHRWQELFDLAHIAVLTRPGPAPAASQELRAICAGRQAEPGQEPAAAGAVLALDMLPLELSSTQVRALLMAGRSPRLLLPDAVLDYIEEHRLYAPCP